MTEKWKPKSQGGDQPSEAKKTSPLLYLALGCGAALLLMVPVTGILAAIAIPNFLAMQLRAKRAEAPSNLDGLRTAQKAYFAEFDQFLELPPCPEGDPRREPVPFEGACVQAYLNLGWVPDAPVRCRYGGDALNVPGDLSASDFSLRAWCDLDGDGQFAIYQADRSQRARMQSGNNLY